MTAVILAGGKGTRLRSVLGDVPKPMADIAGTPFLELVLENLRRHGADAFVLCVSHLRHAIERHFGASFRGVPLRYSVEEEPLGTGGAVKQAFELFGLKEALVANGDTFVQADYASFWELGAQERLAVLLTHVPNADRYGRVQVHEGRITAFHEKSGNGAPGLINAGAYRVTAGLFSGMPRAFSFERDLLEARVAELRPLMFPAGGYFIDIGVPESYAQACRELKAVVERGSAVHEVAHLRDAIALLPQRGDGGALFLDRDGVINVDRHYVHKVEDCEFIDGIFELCREARARGCKIIVVTNQAGIAKGYFTEGDFHNFMAHMAREFQRQDCPLDDVFYCPFHKDGQGIYRKDSEDRKPRPGMLLKAAQKHGIALGNSVLIGDTPSDIEAGRRAGLARCIFYKAQG